VINLTGTVIHTNLGRALLADEAIAQIVATMTAPTIWNSTFRAARAVIATAWSSRCCAADRRRGGHGCEQQRRAVLLTLAALARGRQVIVSRGELVEIGGSFRMPDVIGPGARLVEVGPPTRRTWPIINARSVNGPR